jgi:thymidylate kinase
LGRPIEEQMIVEIVGPGGVGKSTVEPLVATRLGIAYYPAQKRQGLDGQELSSAEVWLGRAVSVLRSPGLAFASWRAYPGSQKARIRFALDMCRRRRISTRASRMGSGVVASGAAHALCAASANNDTDLTGLMTRFNPADVYVRLSGDPHETTERLAARQGIEAEDLAGHRELQQSYETYADAVLEGLESEVVEVKVRGGPEEVAAEIVSRLRPIMP